MKTVPGYEIVRFPKILPLNGGFLNPLAESVANIKITTSKKTATALLKFMSRQLFFLWSDVQIVWLKTLWYKYNVSIIIYTRCITIRLIWVPLSLRRMQDPLIKKILCIKSYVLIICMLTSSEMNVYY